MKWLPTLSASDCSLGSMIVSATRRSQEKCERRAMLMKCCGIDVKMQLVPDVDRRTKRRCLRCVRRVTLPNWLVYREETRPCSLHFTSLRLSYITEGWIEVVETQIHTKKGTLCLTSLILQLTIPLVCNGRTRVVSGNIDLSTAGAREEPSGASH